MKNATVKIVGHSDIGEKMCAAAGRISTQDGTALQIWDKSQDDEKNANLIVKVTRSGHNSTVEHAHFNIAFNDVSVVTEQFMIEFRLASFTVKSRRYVNFGNAGYLVPEFDNDEIKNKYISHMDYLFSFYNRMIENDIPKEDARFVLPYCFKSNFFCSLNGRELVHVIEAMLFGRGKDNKELHTLGLSLLEQAKEIAPGIFSDFEERHGKYSDKLNLEYKAKQKYENKPLVELLNSCSDAEKAIASSALLQENEFTPDEIDSILSNEENVDKIIASVIKSSRPRALENANYTFRLNNVSLACITHFARHRIQAINIPSLSKSDRTSYIIPPSLENSDLLEEYKACFEKTSELYNVLKAHGVDEETLTYVLLAGNTLDFTITMNARELLLFLSLRTCTRAQWEIQNYANNMLNILRDCSPSVFKHFGPSCFVTGICPEGRLSCGQIKEVKEKYSN